MNRHTLTRLLLTLSALAALACNESHGVDTPPAPSGGGVCCPVTDFTGCSPGADPLPAGGWAAASEDCTRTISGYDGRPFERITDPMGCPLVQEGSGCCGCVPPLPDAGPEDAAVDRCEGLGAAACFADADCSPVFDDACCSSCTPGPCADCTDYTFVACRPFDGCREYCGASPAWACFPSAPDCSMAVAVDGDSCSLTGCVPVTPPAGEPSPMGACVPITGVSCTASCERLPPDCPAGTVPEADGSCYTDRCIPAFVCD